jgi:Flp pilus assembly protein TadG
MTVKAALLSRFIASSRGVAAVEFAIILPVMLVLCLGSFDATNAIAIYIKVRAATATLADISNQYKTIHDSDMQQILGATSVVLSPYASAPAQVVVSELKISSSKKAKVSWSDALNGTARKTGSSVTIPKSIGPNNSYLIYCEVSYSFTPLFGFFTSGAITLSDNLYTTPRSSTSIARTSP